MSDETVVKTTEEITRSSGDAILAAIAALSAEVHRAAASSEIAEKQMRSLSVEVTTRLNSFDGRLSSVEDELRAGVRPPDDTRKQMPSVTSEVRDSIKVMALDNKKQTEIAKTNEELARRIEQKTDIQTPMLQKIASSQETAGIRNAVAVFIGMVLATMLGQCQWSIPVTGRTTRSPIVIDSSQSAPPTQVQK